MALMARHILDGRGIPIFFYGQAYMGSLDAMATGGTKVGTLDPAGEDTAEASFEIPAELAGLGRISIRIVSDKSGYYGYNWFYNQTYP